MKENNEYNIRSLAEELRLNYIDASIVHVTSALHDRLDLRENVIKEIQSDENIDKINWRRNILIVGAGATKNAFHNIPLAKDAIDELYSSFRFNINGQEISFRDITNKSSKSIKHRKSDGVFNLLESLQAKYRIEKEKLYLYDKSSEPTDLDFETALYLLTKFFPLSQVLFQLHKLYHKRYGPILFYEIVSHLLKHRFIDVVINFNFDEFLDQSIDDELGSTKYSYILSDGDCRPIGDYLIDGGIKKPIYIKPHGTSSHKSLMRFTKDHYYELPSDIKRLLTDLISCKGAISSSDSNERYLNLIIVGCSMESLDLNKIIKKIMDKRGVSINMFIFFYNEGGLIRPRDIKREYHQKFNIDINVHDSINMYPIDIEDIATNATLRMDGISSPTLGVVFERLWDSICDGFKVEYKPRGIDNHKVLEFIFGNHQVWRAVNNRKRGTTFYPESYFIKKRKTLTRGCYWRDRTIIEVLLALARGGGIASLNDMLSDKPGNYFSLYYNSTKGSESFTELCRNVFVSEGGCFLSRGLILDFGSSSHRAFADLFDVVLGPQGLSRSLSKYLKGNRYAVNGIKEHLRNIFESRSSIIRPDFDSKDYYIFSKYSASNLIHTNFSLLACILKIIEMRSWTHVFIVAEHGLYYDLFRKKFSGMKAALLLADRRGVIGNAKDKKVEARNELIANNKFLSEIAEDHFVAYLPANMHNHHIVFFVRETSTSYFVCQGIYYYQKGMSDYVNPIELSETANIKILFSLLYEYWRRSKEYLADSIRGEENVTAFLNRMNSDDAIILAHKDAPPEEPKEIDQFTK